MNYVRAYVPAFDTLSTTHLAPQPSFSLRLTPWTRKDLDTTWTGLFRPSTMKRCRTITQKLLYVMTMADTKRYTLRTPGPVTDPQTKLEKCLNGLYHHTTLFK